MNNSVTSTRPLLEGENLACTRGDRRLFADLNFSVSPAECLHLLGNNGSGKTSLLRIISGINRADQGDVRWCGKSAIDDSNNRIEFLRNLAYLGHKDGLKNELTAIENLSFYQRMEDNFDVNQIDHDLARMGILQQADITVSKLSFGQRRRLAFARLLRADFKLWILDEPFTGIDRDGRLLIEEICTEHLQSNGAIVLTNHQSLSGSLLAEHLSELRL